MTDASSTTSSTFSTSSTSRNTKSTSGGNRISIILNESCIRLEFLGKPEEYTDAHLLRTNGWMNTHAYVEIIKVQFLCHKLIGKAWL